MTYALRNVVLERCSFFTECFLTYAKSLVPLVNSLDNRHRKRISTMVFPQPRRSTVNLKRYMPRVYPMLRLSSWKQPIAEYTLRTPQIGLKALSQNYKRKPLEHVNVVHVLDLIEEMESFEELETVASTHEQNHFEDSPNSVPTERKSSECESIILETIYEKTNSSDTASN